MGKKQLNVDSIRTELSDSVFFRDYRKQQSPTEPVDSQEPTTDKPRTPSTTSTPVPPVRAVPPVYPLTSVI
jgi:hypothetical protein